MLLTFRLPIHTPVACAVFPHEIVYQSESLLQPRYRNLVQFNHLPRGGHFAAMEEPQLLADDVWPFVEKVEKKLKEEEEEKLSKAKETKKNKKKDI